MSRYYGTPVWDPGHNPLRRYYDVEEVERSLLRLSPDHRDWTRLAMCRNAARYDPVVRAWWDRCDRLEARRRTVLRNKSRAALAASPKWQAYLTRLAEQRLSRVSKADRAKARMRFRQLRAECYPELTVAA